MSVRATCPFTAADGTHVVGSTLASLGGSGGGTFTNGSLFGKDPLISGNSFVAPTSGDSFMYDNSTPDNVEEIVFVGLKIVAGSVGPRSGPVVRANTGVSQYYVAWLTANQVQISRGPTAQVTVAVPTTGVTDTYRLGLFAIGTGSKVRLVCRLQRTSDNKWYYNSTWNSTPGDLATYDDPSPYTTGKNGIWYGNGTPVVEYSSGWDTAGSPTKVYLFSAAAVGTINVASNLYAFVDGPVTAALTMSDGGAGGSFSAIPSWSGGTPASVALTYTGTAYGPATISETNNGGLTDAPSFALTVMGAPNAYAPGDLWYNWGSSYATDQGGYKNSLPTARACFDTDATSVAIKVGAATAPFPEIVLRISSGVDYPNTVTSEQTVSVPASGFDYVVVSGLVAGTKRIWAIAGTEQGTGDSPKGTFIDSVAAASATNTKIAPPTVVRPVIAITDSILVGISNTHVTADGAVKKAQDLLTSRTIYCEGWGQRGMGNISSRNPSGSSGGTTLRAALKSRLESYVPSYAVSAGSVSGNVVTLTIASHGLQSGDLVYISGATPAEYNGTYPVVVVDSTHIKYYVASPPAGAWSSGGTVRAPATFFGQVAFNDYYYGGLSTPPYMDSPSVTISSGTNSGTTCTITTSAAHNFTNGDSVKISGCTPAAYNGTFTVTVTGSTTFTYTAGSDPGGSITVAGTCYNVTCPLDWQTTLADAVDQLHTDLPNANVQWLTALAATSEAANARGFTLGAFRTAVNRVAASRSWLYVKDGSGTNVINTATDIAATPHLNTGGSAKVEAKLEEWWGVPAKPVGLNSSSSVSGKVDLSWTANGETDLAGTPYTISYGTIAGGPYPNTTTSATNSKSITGLTPGTTVYFVVQATDASGNTSPYSLEQSQLVSAGDTSPPTVTVNTLARFGDGSVQVNLDFADASLVSAASFSGSNVRAIGVNAYSHLMDLDDGPGADGSPVTANYLLGGASRPTVPGLYTVRIEGNQISDTLSNFVAQQTIGTLVVPNHQIGGGIGGSGGIIGK